MDYDYKKHVPCHFCGSKKTKAVYTPKDTNSKFTIYLCKSCSYIFSSPVPTKEEIDKIYSGWYEKSSAISPPKNFDEIFEKPKHKLMLRRERELGYTLKFLKKYKRLQKDKKWKLLDFGCGWGNFLVGAKKYFDCSGLEISRANSKFVTDVLKIKCYSDEIENMKIKPCYFDVITAIHSLEHVRNIKSTFNHFYNILKEKGLLVVFSPNFNSFSHQQNKANWKWLTPDVHVSHFTPNFFRKNLKKIGFKILYMGTEEGHYGNEEINKLDKKTQKTIDREKKNSEIVLIAQKDDKNLGVKIKNSIASYETVYPIGELFPEHLAMLKEQAEACNIKVNTKFSINKKNDIHKLLNDLRKYQFKNTELPIIFFNDKHWRGNLQIEKILLLKKIHFLKLNNILPTIKTGSIINFIYRSFIRFSQKTVIEIYHLFIKLPISILWVPYYINIIINDRRYSDTEYNHIRHRDFQRLIKFISNPSSFFKEASLQCHDFNVMSTTRKYKYFVQISYYLTKTYFNKTYLTKTNNKVNNVLVIKLDHLGDILHTMPSTTAIKTQYPNATIDALVGPWSYKLAKKFNIFNNIFQYNPGTKTFDRSLKHIHNNFSLLKDTIILNKMFKKKYDIVFDPSMRRIENFRICLAVSAQTRLGTKYNIMLPLYPWIDKSVPYKIDYEAERIYKTLSPIVKKNNSYKVSLTYKTDLSSKLYINNLFHYNKISAKHLISVALASPWLYRMWPINNYIRTIKNLTKNGYYTALLGDEGEKRYALEILKSLNRNEIRQVYNLFGKTTLDQSIEIIRRSKIFICNDGGLFHFATAIKTPTIVVFGPGEVKRWYPFKNINTKILYKKFPCSPCSQDKCHFNGRCTKAISVKNMMNKIDILLNQAR